MALKSWGLFKQHVPSILFCTAVSPESGLSQFLDTGPGCDWFLLQLFSFYRGF